MSIAPLMSEIAHAAIVAEEACHATCGSMFAPAFGLYTCAFAGGTVIGPVWGGLILESYGWGTMTSSLAGLACMASITTAIFLRE
jgi:MFS family permease